MENKINERRRGQYKKTFEDPRRWREDVMTQIRKDTRIEALNKRRQGMGGGIPADTTNEVVGGLGGFPVGARLPGNVGNGFSDGQGPPVTKILTDEEVGYWVNEMRSSVAATRNAAVELIRKSLSVESGPPIDSVIKFGAIPMFMEFLNQEDDIRLQFEAAWCLTNIASGDSEQTKTVIEAGGVPAFCKLLKSNNPEMREQAVWAIGNLSGDNVETRDAILSLDALSDLKRLIHMENNSLDHHDRIPFLTNCTWTISNLLRGKPVPPFSVTNVAVTLLHKLIYLNEPDIQSDACWAISYITDAATSGQSDNELESRINDVLFIGMGFRICELINSPHQNVQIPALRSAGNIVTGTDDQTQTMILSGIVPALKKLINHSNITVQKEAVWAISNITAGNRCQIQEVLSYGLVPAMLDRLHHAEFEVKKEAAWAISNALTGGNSQQVSAIVKYGCFGPLCDMLKTHDEKCIMVVLDAISSILKHGQQDAVQQRLEENPYATLLEQSGGYDRLEYLSGLNDGIIRTRAIDIIKTYLETEDESDLGEDETNWQFD